MRSEACSKKSLRISPPEKGGAVLLTGDIHINPTTDKIRQLREDNTCRETN